MNIEEKFRQETGKSLYADSSKEIGFSSEYVNWLEQQLRLYVVTKRNWFQKMPLHWRYLYYMFGGIVIGLLLHYVW